MEIHKHRFVNLFGLKTNRDIYIYTSRILYIIPIMINDKICQQMNYIFDVKNIVGKSLVDHLSRY